MATPTRKELENAANTALLREVERAGDLLTPENRTASAHLIHALAYASWVAREGTPPPTGEPLYPEGY